MLCMCVCHNIIKILCYCVARIAKIAYLEAIRSDILFNMSVKFR